MRCIGGERELRDARLFDWSGNAPADEQGTGEDDEQQHRRDEQLGHDERVGGLGDLAQRLRDGHPAGP